MKIEFSGNLDQFLRLIETFKGKSFTVTATLTEDAKNGSLLSAVNTFAASNNLPSLNQSELDEVVRTLREYQGTPQGKIPAIKVLRELANCDLKEARYLVEYIQNGL